VKRDLRVQWQLFVAVAAFIALIAVVYWFVSYEVAGTVLLLAFGIATGFAAVILALDVRRTGRGGGLRRRPLDWVLLTRTADDPPFGDEAAGVPSGSFAPLEIGLGIAVAAMGLVFGPWLIPLGLVPIAMGAGVCLREAMAEHRLVRALDADTAPRPGTREKP
jgi:uncharacterized membrane protein YfcA